jgi:glutamyl-tRNA synthetase
MAKKEPKNKKKKMTDTEETILKIALDNARKHEGKASTGAVIGKLISEMPEAKTKLKELTPSIQEIIAEVNSQNIEYQIEKLKEIAPELLEEKKIIEIRELKELKNAEKGKVVLRLAPSPSGPLHIGHAFVLSINSEYAKKYKGKFILRIDDTNPENIYAPAYELIENDAKWLTENNVSEVICQSDRIKNYYDYAEKLVLKGNAYVCTCNPDECRKMISQKKACPCRNLPSEEQQKRWDKMFVGYKTGEAVLKIKTNINDPNPALRDWSAFRINETKHPRQETKYRVWPLMNFAVACDDHDHGITHTIRGKDHMDNAKKQAQICDFFGWEKPIDLYFGRINFEGIKLSTSETKIAIEREEYEDWDDIRLPTLLALRRRGYQPEAFVQFAIDIGLSQTDKTVAIEEFFKKINSYNREIIEPKSNRYFFVDNPVKIFIEDAPEKTVEIELHPDFPKKGKRKFEFKKTVLITKKDHNEIKENNLCRLMECINFIKSGEKFVFDSEEYEKYRSEGVKIIHWLPEDDLVVAEVLMPDKKILKGVAEKDISKLKKGDIIQFERFGFCRLDNIKDDVYSFWFLHK